MFNIKEPFDNYFNLGFIGIALTSLEQCRVEVNEKLYKSIDYPQQEIIKLSVAKIIYPDDLKANISLNLTKDNGKNDSSLYTEYIDCLLFTLNSYRLMTVYNIGCQYE